VMEVDPRYARQPEALNDIYIPTGGYAVPAGGLAATPSGGLSGGTTASSSSGRTAAQTAGTGGRRGGPAGTAVTRSPSAGSSGAGLAGLAILGGSAATIPPSGTIASLGASNAPQVGVTGAASVTGSAASGSAGSTAAGSSSGVPAVPLLPLRDASNGNPVSVTPKTMVPLAAIAHFATSSAPTSVNHQNGAPATTISFNLAPGYSLNQAAAAFRDAEARIHMPVTVSGSFQGTARTFQSSVGDEPVLIAAALITIYIVLGVLYESYVHPLTVLSTLPSAGIGALLALMLFNMEFSIIALIGVILLIGIVKKNAILIIDFALDAERARGLSSREAIREAAILRFRPIIMTTAAAALGALP